MDVNGPEKVTSRANANWEVGSSMPVSVLACASCNHAPWVDSHNRFRLSLFCFKHFSFGWRLFMEVSLFMPTGWKPNQRFVGFFEVFIWYSGVGWGGVGWGNNVHGTLLQVLVHMYYINVHATLLQVLLRFPTYVMLRCCKVSCTSLHTDMLRCCKFSCASLHTYMLRCCTFCFPREFMLSHVWGGVVPYSNWFIFLVIYTYIYKSLGLTFARNPRNSIRDCHLLCCFRQAVDTAPCEGVLNFDIPIFFVCAMF